MKKTAAAKTKVKTKVKAKVKAKPVSKLKPKPKLKLKPKAKTKSAAKIKAVPKAQAKAKPNAQAKSHENIAAIFSPLDDRLIIEQVEAATRTAGGLFIPDTVKDDDRPKQGKVLAVGRGHQNKKGKIQPLDVKLGDIVLFEGFMGSPLKFGSRECVVIRESQILGIIRG